MYGPQPFTPRTGELTSDGAPLSVDADAINRGIERCRCHITHMYSKGRYCEGAILVLTRLERRLAELKRAKRANPNA